MRIPKKSWPFILIAVFFVLAGGFYLLFPSTTETALKSGGAVALEAWNGTFGVSSDDSIVSDDDTSASDTAVFTSDASSGDVGNTNSPFPEEENSFISPAPAKNTKKNTTTSTAELPIVNSSVPSTDFQSAPSSSTKDFESTILESTTTASSPACAIATPSTASKEIILNEIAWMGTPLASGETATQASGHEWIELKNNSSEMLSLSGWSILDRSGSVKIIFGDGDAMAPGGYFLLARNANDVSGVVADKNYSGGMSNTGDMLVLFDAQCNVSDFIDASSGWPAGNNTTKQTLERDADGIGWHTSVPPGGTPRAPNSDPAPEIGDQGNVVINLTPPSELSTTVAASTNNQATTTASSSLESPNGGQTPCPTDHLVIAAVMIAGASSTNDFVKIFDPTADAVDISGWKLRKKSSTGTDSSLRVFPDGSSIAPGGYFAWANSAGGFGDALSANVTSAETLAADNSIALEDASGTVVDAVAWGTGSNQYAEGSAYPTDPVANQILTRNVSNGAIVDTDNNANDFTLQSQ